MSSGLKIEKKAQVVGLLRERNSIRAIERITGIHCDTVLMCCLLILFPYHSLMASLVICVYQNNELYVASDSCSTIVPKAGTTDVPVTHFQSKKIFKVADTSCVSITGGFGNSLTDQNNGQTSVVFLPNELENICNNLNSKTGQLQSDIATTVLRFNMRYSNYVNHALAAGVNNKDIDGTRICFWGYDDSTRVFFGLSCFFQGTNSMVLEPAFDSASTPVYIGIQGEDTFLPSIIREPDKFAELRSDEFNKTIRDISAGIPVSEERMINCILKMFYLHKTYAAQLSSDKGWIGEPYVIYKITDKDLVKIY